MVYIYLGGTSVGIHTRCTSTGDAQSHIGVVKVAARKSEMSRRPKALDARSVFSPILIARSLGVPEAEDYSLWVPVADPGQRNYLGFETNDGRSPRCVRNAYMRVVVCRIDHSDIKSPADGVCHRSNRGGQRHYSRNDASVVSMSQSSDACNSRIGQQLIS